MTLKVGETGKIFRVAAGFDMSSYTELALTFTKPSGTVVIKLTADGVTIGAGVTDPTLGVLSANEYVDYEIEAGLLDEASILDTDGTYTDWQVYLTYTNTAVNPDDIFIGNCTTFRVGGVTCS